MSNPCRGAVLQSGIQPALQDNPPPLQGEIVANEVHTYEFQPDLYEFDLDIPYHVYNPRVGYCMRCGRSPFHRLANDDCPGSQRRN